MSAKPRYAIACPTSMGVRMTPEDRRSVQVSNRYLLQSTSAESNVLNIASSLGNECLVLTKFIEGSPIFAVHSGRAAGAQHPLRRRERSAGRALGYRHQFNIADSGFGLRGPRVWNDRTGEVGRTLRLTNSISNESSARRRGNSASLRPDCRALAGNRAFCAELAKRAKSYGTKIASTSTTRFLLERARRRAFPRVPQHRGAGGYSRGQRGGFSACARHSGPKRAARISPPRSKASRA